MRLTVVIPSWNTGAALVRHLPRVVAEAARVPGGAETLVVDDGSDSVDAALEEIVHGAGDEVRLLTQHQHLGFSATCNAGAAQALGSFLLFLNTDIHVEEGCFETLLEVIEERPELFAVTPVIINLEEGFPESTTRLRFHHGVFDAVLSGRSGGAAPAPGSLRPVAFGCGGALVCRRSVFLELGGFATLYAPFYWEDIDLGWRARRLGLEVLEVSGARVLHDHARTIGAHYDPRAVRRVYERNRLLFTWVHLAGWRFWLSHLTWLPVRWVAAALRRDPGAAATMSAFRRIPAVVRERRHLAATRGRSRKLLDLVSAAGAGGWPAPVEQSPRQDADRTGDLR